MLGGKYMFLLMKASSGQNKIFNVSNSFKTSLGNMDTNEEIYFFCIAKNVVLTKSIKTKKYKI